MAKRMPFHVLGSRRSLCFNASVMACPLMFSIAGIVQSCCTEPTPIDSANGIGASMCAASYSRLMALSRTMAQLGVFTTVTFRP